METGDGRAPYRYCSLIPADCILIERNNAVDFNHTKIKFVVQSYFDLRLSTVHALIRATFLPVVITFLPVVILLLRINMMIWTMCCRSLCISAALCVACRYAFSYAILQHFAIRPTTHNGWPKICLNLVEFSISLQLRAMSQQVAKIYHN